MFNIPLLVILNKAYELFHFYFGRHHFRHLLYL
jgi:hypothetical protein